MTSPLSSKQVSDHQKLRQLILGELAESKIEQLSNNDITYISNLISEALISRNNKDDSLNHALAPVIDGALERTIKKDPHKIADIFYPIIGPAIRKSVSSALFEMVQSLNQLLEQSLSLKSLSWRFKAWRSGKNYAEYVLLRTLKYRVEQVFLIHRETGILISSAIASQAVAQDPDLVSSMLTAINDFVADSFEADNESLEWLKFGDLTLQIVVGPKAVIATATRGSAGKYITRNVTEVLEKIHHDYYTKLNHFDGDSEQWRFVEPLLESCLISRLHHQRKKQKPWFAFLLILTGLGYLIYTQYLSYQITIQQDSIIDLVNENDNYLLLSQQRYNNNLNITLVRDIQTKEFRASLAHINQKDINIEVKEIALPLDQQKNLLPYIHALTQSPETLTLETTEKTLLLSGEATRQQVNKIINNPMIKTIFDDFDSSDLVLVSSEKVVSPKELKNQQLKLLHNQVNGQWFSFHPNSKELSSGELEKFNSIIVDLKSLYLLSNELKQPIRQITLMGFADNQGTHITNQKLSLERAISLRELLIANNIPNKDIIVNGSGNNKNSLLKDKLQRRVTMMVYYYE